MCLPTGIECYNPRYFPGSVSLFMVQVDTLWLEKRPVSPDLLLQGSDVGRGKRGCDEPLMRAES